MMTSSSSSSIFSGDKISPILSSFNSGDRSRRSGCIKANQNKLRFNPKLPRFTPTRLRVEAQSLIPSNGLWAQQATNRGRLKRNIGLGQRSAIFRQEATGISLSQGSNFCLTCKRTQPGIRRSLPSAFQDKTSFSLSKSRFNSSLRTHSQILNATVGPDEPHATGTAWPDGTVAERQDVDLLPPEIDRAELEAFLGTELPSHPKLHRGQLKNGLRYLILPNKVPPNRFEAHMEVHVGSIDEEDDEQGIAHMIEHVAFLGSKKRGKLLGTSARSNAYTDFHHTVFHIHSPTHTKDSEDDHFLSVLDALNEIAFHPKFLSSRVEKERRAILSELQMMNTIEYRVHCQLLQHLHSENKLGRRFPIGLEEQIKKWDVDKVRNFHERWYFPANATLYIVGDINNIPQIVHHIEAVFEKTGLDNETTPTSPTPGAFGAMANFLVPKLPAGLGGTFSHEKTKTVDQSKIIKRERHAIRPPVEHNWSLPGTSVDLKPPQIFKHELLQNFAINMFCKIPVNKVQTFGDLRNVLMKRIFLSALHFRINTRYKSSNPPFTSVELDHSDSGREGCTLTTLTVTAEPKNWQNAVKVAVQEVRRLKEFGVTRGELTCYMDALLKDSEHLAAMIDNVSSVDNLEFIMESDALGHTVMDQTQGHETLVAVAGTVTLEEVNTVGAKVLEFISDFGRPTAPLPAAIVACVPIKVHVDGVGESEFNISLGEILDSVKSGLLAPIEAEPELEVPKELISQLQLQELNLQRNPSFTPIPGSGVTKMHDKETGITQLRLSNGIPVNYKISKTESRAGVMRLIVGGGRAAETFPPLYRSSTRLFSSPSSSFPHHTLSSSSLALSSSFLSSSLAMSSSSSLQDISSHSITAVADFCKDIADPKYAPRFRLMVVFILVSATWCAYLTYGSGSEGSISFPFLDPAKYGLSSDCLATIIRLLAPAISLPSVEASSTAIAILFCTWCAIRLKRFFLFRMNAPKDRLLVTDTMFTIAGLACALASIVNLLGTGDQKFLTFGGLGLGGAATAFASKDILGNILSGLSLLFANPFSLGDTIQVGSTEGEVVRIGLTATSLLDPLTMSVISVPNSEIANKLLENRSRSPCRGLSFRIPLDLNTVANLPLISQEIIDALKGNKKIFLEKGLPFCHLFQGTECFSELRIGCYITRMSREEYYSTQEQIFQDIIEILKKHRIPLPKTLNTC